MPYQTMDNQTGCYLALAGYITKAWISYSDIVSTGTLVGKSGDCIIPGNGHVLI